MLCKTISVFFLLFGRKFFGIVAFRCSLTVSPPQKWRGSPVQKAWSQLNSRRKVFYIKKYSLVCISFYFFLFSHLITYHFAILRFGMYLQTFLQRNFPINTYHFVNYQFDMYLQTNFPIILLFHTYQIANPTVWYVFVNCKYLFSYRKHIPFG